MYTCCAWFLRLKMPTTISPGYISVNRDITEKIIAEEKVRRMN